MAYNKDEDKHFIPDLDPNPKNSPEAFSALRTRIWELVSEEGRGEAVIDLLVRDISEDATVAAYLHEPEGTHPAVHQLNEYLVKQAINWALQSYINQEL